MKGCDRLEAGEVELYFYDELGPDARASAEEHIASCESCREALEELEVIRSALSARPVVQAPAADDWSGFMRRLDTAIDLDTRVRRATEPVSIDHSVLSDRAATADRTVSPVRSGMRHAWMAMAALVTLTAMSVAYVASSVSHRASPAHTQAGGEGQPQQPLASPSPASASRQASSPERAFTSLSEQHFERSKLVVLGLTTKDARRVRVGDWEYERQLASSLLQDTRLYRLAAEERGMTRLATVMGDLELVLLQTSLAERPGSEDLEQIQRLIQKRDLVTKMDGF